MQLMEMKTHSYVQVQQSQVELKWLREMDDENYCRRLSFAEKTLLTIEISNFKNIVWVYIVLIWMMPIFSNICIPNIGW